MSVDPEFSQQGFTAKNSSMPLAINQSGFDDKKAVPTPARGYIIPRDLRINSLQRGSAESEA